MKNEEFTKKTRAKTKITPTTQCEDDFYYYLYTGYLFTMQLIPCCPHRHYFYFSKQIDRKMRFFLTK